VAAPGVFHTGGTIILAALGYVLGVVYVRSGTAGVKAWLRAKFTNQVTATSKEANK
jgi:hypothetical protein